MPSSEPSQAPEPGQQDRMRAMSRSPHPYHHQSADLPDPSHRLGVPRPAGFSKESSPGSDSGTEADDEHILKGLPAPKVKLHKGLRGRNEVFSGASTPNQSQLFEHTFSPESAKIKPVRPSQHENPAIDIARRNKNLVRRVTEVFIVLALSTMVVRNSQVLPVARYWRNELLNCAILCAALAVLYPLRILRWTYWNRSPKQWLPIRLPHNFDPAPLLYPPAITILVSLLVSPKNRGVMLPNLILGLCALPQQVIPKLEIFAHYDTLHWALTCLPLLWCRETKGDIALAAQLGALPLEAAVLLYPLQRTTSIVLHHLTTTSLLSAELQLLGVALVDVLILAVSPQIQILKGLLWIGGVAVLLLCDTVIRWGITLARVPRWRFRRPSITSQKRPLWKSVAKALSWAKTRGDARSPSLEDILYETPESGDSDEDVLLLKQPARTQTFGNGHRNTTTATPESPDTDLVRRHTLATPEKPIPTSTTHTSSGRKKRGTSVSAKPFLKLTYEEAGIRKWAYAAYVYTTILLVILVGVRTFVQIYALNGNEPIGWALGYLLGGISWFRFQVVHSNFDHWVCLPPLLDSTDRVCTMGWVQHIRANDFGEANTRLLLSGYWLTILIFGLLIVFQLKDTYEVDTRRKVFHFMMVGMFIPATFVDPAYAALALALILAVFLILDLLRASQLPPLSKPLAAFLAPYVDGRDFRGPVVISHIFLLIGCAIPLWLALGSLPRTGSGFATGWEVPTRDVSMLAGVICVGLGDAAASLIGRRWGHRKWIWGGGKSLEGSVAFAVAVFIGLMVSVAWLRIGGWPVSEEPASILVTSRNAGVCATIASLTEAVLTGGNDNVVVPVILWTCVKSLAI